MKIAFVSPFFGADTAGGAESECRNTAIRLASSGISVDILTSCIRDLGYNWNFKYHRHETREEDGLTVRRFQTEHVDLDKFCDLNTQIIHGAVLTPEKQKQFMAMFLNSPDLYRYLAEHGDEYKWICFIPYLFGLTVYGSMIKPEKTILIPCLHDEGYARLQAVRELFQRCARIVFHTNAEYELAKSLYGQLPGKAMVIGEGVDTHLSSNASRFLEKYKIFTPFVLYAGRKGHEKNVHTLIRYFTAYKEKHRNDLKLVLIGPAALPIPSHMKNDILDLGFIPKQDKNDAYSAATVFCQPSRNESFSIVIMEAWLCQTPCLVDGKCAVTREHVVRSGGGLYFENYSDFEGCLNYFLNQPVMRQNMGESGRQYVLKNFEWDSIIQTYINTVFAD